MVVSPTSVSATAQSTTRGLSYQELDILHCLRGFCAFYVVVFHAKYILWAGGHEYMKVFPRATWSVWQYVAFIADMLSSAGYEMVIFFFVLSGFFIRYAQQRKYRAPIAFYLNRIVRIYPPYLISVVLAVVVLLLLARLVPQMFTTVGNRELNTTLLAAWNDLRNLDLVGVVRTLLFLPLPHRVYIGYNTVYWSLLPEALFYAAVPLAFWRIQVYYLVSTLLYLLGIGASALHYSLEGVTSFLLAHNFYFALGVALYDVVVRTQWLTWFRRIPGWLLGGTLLVLFVMLISLALFKLKIFSALIAVLLAVISISALLGGRVSRRNVVVRIFHPIGLFSFSLYLYHYPLLLLCSGLVTILTGHLVIYTRYYWLAVPMVTLICYALYWATERASVNFFRKV
jgi:peptidoglycan/LPS O-acetylase OafA/YrhL